METLTQDDLDIELQVKNYNEMHDKMEALCRWIEKQEEWNMLTEAENIKIYMQNIMHTHTLLLLKTY